MRRTNHLLPLMLCSLIVFAIVAGACAVPPNVSQVPVEVTRVVEVQQTRVVDVQPTGAAPAAAEGRLELITPGELVIGFEPQPGIFELDAEGKATGLFGTMITEVAKRLNLKPVYTPLAFPALIPALQSHRIDVNSAGFSITQPRAQIVYYGPPWLFGPETLAVLPGTQIPSWEYAAEKKLTLATGAGYYYVGIWEEMGIPLHTFDSPDACFLDVVNKAAAGCAVGVYFHAQRKINAPDGPGAKLESIVTQGPRVTADLNAIGLNKDAPNLARTLSRVINQLHREGFVEQATKDNLNGQPEYKLFLQPPPGHAVYVPGPWEQGVVPPASEVYPTNIATVAPGTLTVGVVGKSPMLQLSGDTLSGPEADILKFAAGKLGLTLKGVAVTEADAAKAVRDGTVDLIAGAVPATEEASHQYWQSTPIGFDPDYIYVAPGEGGGLPAYTKWEDIKDGPIAVITGNSRTQAIKDAGVAVLEVADAAAGLQALVDGTAKAFVGSSLDYATAASSNEAIANKGIGWVRNINPASIGYAYSWGVRGGNDVLLDALNQAITAAWQQNIISEAYKNAFPKANTSVLLAPGPTAIGTSFGSSKDFSFRSMWMPGTWAQRPGWVQ